MIKYKTNSKNEGLVEDPHELLLSLVDMGSLDADECLLACVTEMSDAECKRVLNSISLPNNCCGMEDDIEDDTEDDVAIEPADDTVLDLDKHEDEIDDEDFGDEELEEEDVDEAKEVDEENETDEEAELEARICRLERCLHSESMNRNRIHRFPHRKTNC